MNENQEPRTKIQTRKANKKNRNQEQISRQKVTSGSTQ